MKFSRSMILWGTVLSLSGFFGGMPSVLADDDDRTTASEVVDPETNMVDPEKLKAFVLSARDHYTSITNLSELFTLRISCGKKEGIGTTNPSTSSS